MTMTIINDKYGFRFRDWDIYKDARTLRTELWEIMNSYPKEEKFSLIDQTRRALDSIILNIAEGANKNSDKETRLYVNRAHGSLDEVVACLDCAFDEKYISKETHEKILEKASSLAKRLRKFGSYLFKSP
ncbi:MAG: four helix bundle protein [Patescibacteria group bacterium]